MASRFSAWGPRVHPLAGCRPQTIAADRTGKTVRRTIPIVLVVGLVIAALVGATGLVSARPAAVPRLAHVVVVVFENQERSTVLGTGQAPTFDRLAGDYAQATDYQAVAHPSLPNYLALISGSTHGVTNDCTNCPQSGPTIGTEL